MAISGVTGPGDRIEHLFAGNIAYALGIAQSARNAVGETPATLATSSKRTS